MEPRNFIGPVLRRLRMEKGWTQQRLAAECAVNGWDITRTTVAKVESGFRGVNDAEIWLLAEMLGEPVEIFFHPESANALRPIHSQAKAKRKALLQGRMSKALNIVRHSRDPDL